MSADLMFLVKQSLWKPKIDETEEELILFFGSESVFFGSERTNMILCISIFFSLPNYSKCLKFKSLDLYTVQVCKHWHSFSIFVYFFKIKEREILPVFHHMCAISLYFLNICELCGAPNICMYYALIIEIKERHMANDR